MVSSVSVKTHVTWAQAAKLAKERADAASRAASPGQDAWRTFAAKRAQKQVDDPPAPANPGRKVEAAASAMNLISETARPRHEKNSPYGNSGRIATYGLWAAAILARVLGGADAGVVGLLTGACTYYDANDEFRDKRIAKQLYAGCRVLHPPLLEKLTELRCKEAQLKFAGTRKDDDVLCDTQADIKFNEGVLRWLEKLMATFESSYASPANQAARLNARSCLRDVSELHAKLAVAMDQAKGEPSDNVRILAAKIAQLEKESQADNAKSLRRYIKELKSEDLTLLQRVKEEGYRADSEIQLRCRVVTDSLQRLCKLEVKLHKSANPLNVAPKQLKFNRDAKIGPVIGTLAVAGTGGFIVRECAKAGVIAGEVAAQVAPLVSGGLSVVAAPIAFASALHSIKDAKNEAKAAQAAKKAALDKFTICTAAAERHPAYSPERVVAEAFSLVHARKLGTAHGAHNQARWRRTNATVSAVVQPIGMASGLATCVGGPVVGGAAAVVGGVAAGVGGTVSAAYLTSKVRRNIRKKRAKDSAKKREQAARAFVAKHGHGAIEKLCRARDAQAAATSLPELTGLTDLQFRALRRNEYLAIEYVAYELHKQAFGVGNAGFEAFLRDELQMPQETIDFMLAAAKECRTREAHLQLVRESVADFLGVKIDAELAAEGQLDDLPEQATQAEPAAPPPKVPKVHSLHLLKAALSELGAQELDQSWAPNCLLRNELSKPANALARLQVLRDHKDNRLIDQLISTMQGKVLSDEPLTRQEKAEEFLRVLEDLLRIAGHGVKVLSGEEGAGRVLVRIGQKMREYEQLLELMMDRFKLKVEMAKPLPEYLSVEPLPPVLRPLPPLPDFDD